MIQLDKTEIFGWEAAIRGMRNPMNSWSTSDSDFVEVFGDIIDEKPVYLKTTNIGEKDLMLMCQLAKAGSSHAKYRRMITVYTDILAPLYWWKEFDTYKVGTVANSCSTMHKIAEKAFVLDDFSCEHMSLGIPSVLNIIIESLNNCREMYNETNDKQHWWNMIQLLPSSYNQKRTVMMNYEVLANIYTQRKGHRLDEWRDFCRWIEKLPYHQIITDI